MMKPNNIMVKEVTEYGVVTHKLVICPECRYHYCELHGEEAHQEFHKKKLQTNAKNSTKGEKNNE